MKLTLCELKIQEWVKKSINERADNLPPDSVEALTQKYILDISEENILALEQELNQIYGMNSLSEWLETCVRTTIRTTVSEKNQVTLWRRVRGMTISQLAVAAEVEPSVIEKIESGTLPARKIEMNVVEKIAQVLSVKINDLLV